MKITSKQDIVPKSFIPFTLNITVENVDEAITMMRYFNPASPRPMSEDDVTWLPHQVAPINYIIYTELNKNLENQNIKPLTYYK